MKIQDIAWKVAAGVVLAVASVPAVALASTGSSNSGSGTNYSFYPTASAAAVYVDNMIASGRGLASSDTAGSADGNGNWKIANSIGEASNGAGFVDLDSLSKTVGDWDTYIQSSTSRNAVTYSYDAYQKVAASGTDENVADYLIEYGRFGLMLSNLGLDSTGDSGVSSGSRVLIGTVMHGLWYFSNGADNVMQWCFRVLQMLNPFRFIGNTLVGGLESLAASGNKSVIQYDETLDRDSQEQMDQTGDLQEDNVDIEHGTLADNNIKDQLSESDQGRYEELQGQNSDATNTMFSSAAQTMLDWIHTIYNWAYRWAWLIIIPLMIVLLIFILLLSQNRRRGWSVGKRILLTILMLCFFVPLWGTMYTAALANMANMVDAGYEDTTSSDGSILPTNISLANRVVLTTFVDTGGWARTGFNMTGLGIQPALDWSNGQGWPTGQVSAETMSNMRGITLAINEKAARVDATGRASSADFVWAHGSGTEEGQNLGSGNTSGLSSWQQAILSAPTLVGTDGGQTSASDLLTSYTNGEMYEAAEYESYIKGSEPNAQAMATWLQATSNPETYAQGLSKLRGNTSEDAPSIIDNGLLKGGTPKAANSVQNNSQLSELYDALSQQAADDENTDELRDQIMQILQDEQNASANDGEGTSSDSALASIKWFGYDASKTSGVSTAVPEGDLQSLTAGSSPYGTFTGSLSAIGTYNFLNTRFDASGFTVYSSQQSANAQSRVSHYQTSLAGGPVMGILYVIDGIVLMLASSITAIVYGLSLVFTNIKRSLTMIVSIPVAALGMLGAIARALIVGIMMIAELIATAVMYVLMQMLFSGIDSFVSSGIAGAISGILPMTNIFFPVVMLAVSIAVLLVYIILAVRLRGLLVAAINEAVASLSNRLVGLTGDQMQHDTTTNALGRLGQGAIMGMGMSIGRGNALGALGGGLAAVGVGSALMNSGRDSVNGDNFIDANASESSTDNGVKDSTQNTGGAQTENNLDKNSMGGSMMADMGAIEGGARQSGAGTLAGTVAGVLSGLGGDSSTTDAMRTASQDMGSANRLDETSFSDAQSGDSYAGDASSESMLSASSVGSAQGGDTTNEASMADKSVSADAKSALSMAGDSMVGGSGSETSMAANSSLSQATFGGSSSSSNENAVSSTLNTGDATPGGRMDSTFATQAGYATGLSKEGYGTADGAADRFGAGSPLGAASVMGATADATSSATGRMDASSVFAAMDAEQRMGGLMRDADFQSSASGASGAAGMAGAAGSGTSGLSGTAMPQGAGLNGTLNGNLEGNLNGSFNGTGSIDASGLGAEGSDAKAVMGASGQMQSPTQMSARGGDSYGFQDVRSDEQRGDSSLPTVDANMGDVSAQTDGDARAVEGSLDSGPSVIGEAGGSDFGYGPGAAQAGAGRFDERSYEPSMSGGTTSSQDLDMRSVRTDTSASTLSSRDGSDTERSVNGMAASMPGVVGDRSQDYGRVSVSGSHAGSELGHGGAPAFGRNASGEPSLGGAYAQGGMPGSGSYRGGTSQSVLERESTFGLGHDRNSQSGVPRTFGRGTSFGESGDVAPTIDPMSPEARARERARRMSGNGISSTRFSGALGEGTQGLEPWRRR